MQRTTTYLSSGGRTLRLLGAGVVLIWALAACADQSSGGGDGTPNPECVDMDGDGFGERCAAGPDCNDQNPAQQTCDCTDGNFVGCGCEVEGATESCYEGELGTQDIGVCQGGSRTCENGEWTPCIGQILPFAEICNNRDEDCNGINDDGLELNRCGTCDERCDFDAVGSGGSGGDEGRAWDLNDDNSDGLVEANGGIELVKDDFDFKHLWIANSEEGTVSKIDTTTGREVGRYYSAIRVDQAMPRSNATCSASDRNPPGNCPSRTAVDLQGNVWVANRAFAGQGSVTKIAERNCLDKNGNGVIETSNDANGNGRIDISDPAEFFGEQDECILFTVTIGGNQSFPRALAIDPFTPVRGVGSVWVGAWSEDRYYEIDASDGRLVRTVDVDHRPYGAVMDRFGVLWSSDLNFGNDNDPDASLISIVSATGETGPKKPVRSTTGCANSYGITVDRNDYIWVAGFECETAHRYDPSSDSWFTVSLEGNGYARGIAADRSGNLYVGSSHDVPSGQEVGHVSTFKEDGTGVSRITFTGQSSGTIGVGLDSQERVWAINQGTGSATRINTSTNATEHFPVGDGPYTYSDFTGFALRNFTAPAGYFRSVITGCPDDQRTIWLGARWDSTEPPGTGVSLSVRAADTEAELASAPLYGPFDEQPADLKTGEVPPSKFLQVEFTLTSDVPDQSPNLRGYEITWTCPGAQ